jgi:hypothetical protein
VGTAEWVDVQDSLEAVQSEQTLCARDPTCNGYRAGRLDEAGRTGRGFVRTRFVLGPEERSGSSDCEACGLRNLAEAFRVERVSEIGNGLNGKRSKLLSLLRDPHVGTLVVEHRERLA